MDRAHQSQRSIQLKGSKSNVSIGNHVFDLHLYISVNRLPHYLGAARCCWPADPRKSHPNPMGNRSADMYTMASTNGARRCIKLSFSQPQVVRLIV
jgi:hypothetical protein